MLASNINSLEEFAKLSPNFQEDAAVGDLDRELFEEVIETVIPPFLDEDYQVAYFLDVVNDCFVLSQGSKTILVSEKISTNSFDFKPFYYEMLLIVGGNIVISDRVKDYINIVGKCFDHYKGEWDSFWYFISGRFSNRGRFIGKDAEALLELKIALYGFINDTAKAYHANPTNFYNSYMFVFNHPAYWSLEGKHRWRKEAELAVRVSQDDIAIYIMQNDQFAEQIAYSHTDKTYEAAIIGLAKKIAKNYNDNGTLKHSDF